MKKVAVMIILLALSLLGAAGCQRGEPGPQPPAGPTPRGEGGTYRVSRQLDLRAMREAFRPAPDLAVVMPYSPPRFQATLAPYRVEPDLSNVVNREQFGAFSADLLEKLAANAFVVTRGDQEQLFYVYENNDYLNLPSFITSDALLQVYHVFYDYTLRNLEREHLIPLAGKLTAGMLKNALATYQAVEDTLVKEAALANVAYFLVAGRLLQLPDPPGLPEEAVRLAERELSSIAAHTRVRPDNSLVASALFPYKIDYTQFIPRGHYTRSEEFQRYFQAMMWYGNVPLPFRYNLETERQKGLPAYRQIVQAELMVKALGEDPELREYWRQIYEPTAFYVGKADDLTPAAYLDLMLQVYGPQVTLDGLAEQAKLDAMIAAAEKLPPPGIQVQLWDIPGGVAFKFMGQRYIPDSEILQELSDYLKRPFPKGLDVPAVLGSGRARAILSEYYQEERKWADYLPRREKLAQKFGALPPATWQSNLYYGWLWNLQTLWQQWGEGYPSFMTNQAWQDKSLNTALASWAELRHDTILYAKQSGAECGGGEEPPPPPPGYVEPNVELYHRLAWLTDYSRQNLQVQGLLTPEMADRFQRFTELLDFLERVSVKELEGQELTREEYDQIKSFGALLEYLTTSIATDGASSRWFEVTSETDRNMALVADVHTNWNKALEEAVGLADEIFVVVPIEGKLYLTRGAVFSYYEFTHPAGDRLTDEEWQQMLRSPREPARPPWTESFLGRAKGEIPKPRETYSSGC